MFARVAHHNTTGETFTMTTHNRIRYAAIAVALASAGFAHAQGQEVSGGATTTAKPMPGTLTSITQPMLNSAAGDAKNWIHANGSYDQSRYYAGNQINT